MAVKNQFGKAVASGTLADKFKAADEAAPRIIKGLEDRVKAQATFNKLFPQVRRSELDAKRARNLAKYDVYRKGGEKKWPNFEK